MPRIKSREKYIERFLERVKKTPSCWIWEGKKDIGNYGILWYEGKTRKAHRVAWLLFKSEDPGKLCVCHKCDTRDCVNPDHLFIGTRMDNFLDAIKKGRIIPKGGTNHAAKLSDNDVRIIREWYGRPVSYKMLGKLFGVTKQAIYEIINRREWKHVI